MSDYGPPPGSPVQGPPPGQPSYGPPGGGFGQPHGGQGAGAPGAQGPQGGPKAQKAPMDRSAMLGYAAAGLGALSFVWGFLTWLSFGNDSESGYATVGQAVIGLSLAAGLVAGFAVLEKKSLGTVPAALAVAAALVAFGVLVSHGNPDSGVGMILAFITALVQAGVCVFAYLESSRASGSGLSLSGPGGSGTSNQGQSSQGGQSGQGGSAQQGGGYGAPSYGGGGAGGYGGGSSYGPPPGAAPMPSGGGYGQQGGYEQQGGQQGGYEQQGGYGQPGSGGGQQPPPSFEPPTQTHPTPGTGAHAAPQRPEPGSGGGHETTVIPRFPTPPGAPQDPPTAQLPIQGDEERSNATQHIPRFDPPPNPYSAPPEEPQR